MSHARLMPKTQGAICFKEIAFAVSDGISPEALLRKCKDTEDSFKYKSRLVSAGIALLHVSNVLQG